MGSRTLRIAVAVVLVVVAGSACSRSTTGRGVHSSAAATATASPPAVVTGFASAWQWQPDPDGTATVTGVAQGDDLVAVVSCQVDGPCSVTALRESTGVVAWTVPFTGGTAGLPSIAGSSVLVRGDATLQALSVTDGSVRWHDDQVVSTGPSAPTVTGSDVVVVDRDASGQALVRRDAATGKVRSSTALDAGDDASGDLAVVGSVVVLTGSQGVTGRALDSGKVAWNRTDLTDPDLLDPLAVAGPVVAVVSATGAVAVLDPADGTTAWTASPSSDARLSFTPSAVYVTDDGRITARDVSSGRTVWTQSTTAVDDVTATPDGRTVLGCGEDLVSVRAADAALLAIAPATTRCVDPPLVGGLTPNGGTLVTTASDSVVGYTLTVDAKADPVSDPSGAWGDADPASCAVSGTTTATALEGSYGGTWTLTSADPDAGGCVWAQTGGGSLSAAVLLLTADQVAQASDPDSPQSYCGAPLGGTGGSLQRQSLSGLPAGNLVCTTTGWTVLGAVADDDEAALVPRSSGGTVLVAFDGLARGQAGDATQQDHLRTLLAALAAT